MEICVYEVTFSPCAVHFHKSVTQGRAYIKYDLKDLRCNGTPVCGFLGPFGCSQLTVH